MSVHRELWHAATKPRRGFDPGESSFIERQLDTPVGTEVVVCTAKVFDGMVAVARRYRAGWVRCTNGEWWTHRRLIRPDELVTDGEKAALAVLEEDDG